MSSRDIDETAPQSLDWAIAGAAAASMLATGVLGLPSLVVALVWLVLAAGAWWSPVGVASAAIVTLPWFHHPIAVGQQSVPASELLLSAAATGLAARLIVSLAVNRPCNRRATLDALWDSVRAPLIAAGVVLAVVGLLLAIWPYDPSHRAESLREWRWTLAEPLVLIGILALAGRGRGLLVVIALVSGATIAGLQGLTDFITGGGVLVDGARRVAGPYPHPNALGLFLSRVVALGLAWWVIDSRYRRALLIVVAIAGLALLATLSRGAILACGVAGALALWRAPGRIRTHAYAAGGLAALGLLIIVRERMLDLFSGGSGSLRLAIWESALRMIGDRPIRGYGNDQFLYAYLPRYVDPVAWGERFTAHAHNIALDFWVRLGIIGVAFVALAAVVCVVSAWRVARGTDRRDAISGAASIGLIAVLSHGLVDNAYFAHDLAMSAWAMGWLAFGRRVPAQREEAAIHAGTRHRWSWLHRLAPDGKPPGGRS